MNKLEDICRVITKVIGKPVALLIAILVQVIWVVVGQVTHLDPFPFVFLLTVSNILQLILIFVIAVGQQDQGVTTEVIHDAVHERHDDLIDHIDSHFDNLHRRLVSPE